MNVIATECKRLGGLAHCDHCGRFEVIAAIRPDAAGQPGRGEAMCAACAAWTMREPHASREVRAR